MRFGPTLPKTGEKGEEKNPVGEASLGDNLDGSKPESKERDDAAPNVSSAASPPESSDTPPLFGNSIAATSLAAGMWESSAGLVPRPKQVKSVKIADPLSRLSAAVSRVSKPKSITSMMKSTAELRNERKKKNLIRPSHYAIQQVKGDGNCLFRSVSIQVYGDDSWHDRVREECMDYIEKDREHFEGFIAGEDFDAYVRNMRRNGTHGDNTEIQAIAELYNRPVVVFEPVTIAANGTSEDVQSVIIKSNGIPIVFKQLNIFQSKYLNDDAHHAPIRLCYSGRNHYDAIIDPYAATVGVGLGLANFNPGQAERDLLQSVTVVADVEATEKELERAVLEASMKDMLQSGSIGNDDNNDAPNSKRIRVESSGDNVSPVPTSLSPTDTVSVANTLLSIAGDYPSSVRELILNGFAADNVLAAYAVVGDSFDQMLSLLMTGSDQRNL